VDKVHSLDPITSTGQILVIDSYDSFVYNLVQELGKLGASTRVYRNDAITIDEIRALAPKAILISPGPGRPETSGIATLVIQALAGEIPILGVCLGHQVIAQHYGAKIVAAPVLMHGKASPIYHDPGLIFDGLPNPFTAGRYHSLVVDPDTIPACLEVTAKTDDGVVMGIKHRELPVFGIQFHPESILTPTGPNLLANWLALVGIDPITRADN
jgi:anthranilate synthase/aminodeoxychorismate synthase-like glutamine amidotransferase